MPDADLRLDLLYIVRDSGAHRPFREVLEGIPFEVTGVRPPAAAHTLWEVLEHMRIIQWDLIESRNPTHQSPAWPSGYWPERPAPADPEEWHASVRSFGEDHARLCAVITDRNTDLFARATHAKNQTLLQDILLAADHNSYHYAEIIGLRRSLKCWPG